MKYTLLIYESPADFAALRDPKQGEEIMTGVMRYLQALKDAGVFVDGAGLQPPDTATTLRLRDGQHLVQDGPFADIKEQLGGFFIIDAPDLDAALEWAARFPQRPGQAIEVRPNMQHD